MWLWPDSGQLCWHGVGIVTIVHIRGKFLNSEIFVKVSSKISDFRSSDQHKTMPLQLCQQSWPESGQKCNRRHTFFLSLMDPLPRTMILQPVSCSNCLVVIPLGPKMRPTKLNWNFKIYIFNSETCINDIWTIQILFL